MRQRTLLAFGFLLLGSLAGCGGPAENYGPLSYADGSITLNDRCPVRLKPLNPALAPLWINDRPVGFC